MSRDLLFQSSTGMQVSVDTETESLEIGAPSSVALRVDLKAGTVEIFSRDDVSVISGGRIALDAAKGIDIRTGGDLQMIAEGETIIRGKMVRIN